MSFVSKISFLIPMSHAHFNPSYAPHNSASRTGHDSKLHEKPISHRTSASRIIPLTMSPFPQSAAPRPYLPCTILLSVSPSLPTNYTFDHWHFGVAPRNQLLVASQYTLCCFSLIFLLFQYSWGQRQAYFNKFNKFRHINPNSRSRPTASTFAK